MDKKKGLFSGIGSFFNKSFERKHEINKLKAKNSSMFNWTKFWQTFFIIIGICFVSVAVTTTYLIVGGLTGLFSALGNTGASFGHALEVNPELGVLLSGMSNDAEPQTTAMLTSLTLIKQMQIKGNVDMDFKGEFTTKQIRELQKKDLTCIDLYDYKMVNSSELIERTRLEDSKCENFATDHDLKYYKCPKFNCERIEIQRKAVDEFIPKTISVTNLNGEAGGK